MTAKRKTALITGSSKGLGKELALEFSRNEYDTIINGRDKSALREVLEGARKNGIEAYSVAGDITKEETINALIEEARARNIEVLVNNAGMYIKKPLTEMTMDDLKAVMEVNFFAVARLTQKILPIFLRRGEGIIVNMNSVAGEQGSLGESAYSASKHALRGFFDSLRYEVTTRGVRILDVYLGAMQTQMTKGRDTYSLLMNPREVAEMIVKNCKIYKSKSVGEIHIGRINYN